MTDSEKEWQKVIYEREFAKQKKRSDRLESELRKLRDEMNYKRGYEDGKRDAMKWISVKERLPNDNDDVIGAILKTGEWVIRRLNFWRGRWWNWEDGCSERNVTHWMQLPPPPEGGQDD